MAISKVFIITGQRAEHVVERLSRAEGCHFYYTKKGPDGKLAAAFNTSKLDEPLPFDSLAEMVANENPPEIAVGTDREYKKLIPLNYAYVRT